MINQNIVNASKVLATSIIATDLALTLQISALPMEQKMLFQMGSIGLVAATVYLARKNKEKNSDDN